MAQATANRDEIYVKLVNRLNQNPIKFPPIEPVLNFVKELFEEPQAALGAAFPMGAHTLPDLAKIMDRDESDLEKLLDQMETQGLVFSEKKQGSKTRYSLVPFIPGLVEHQFLNGDESPKAIRMAQLYKEITKALGPAAIESYKKPLPPDADLFQLRTLAVEQELPDNSHVATWEQVSALLERENSFAAGTCMCRQINKLAGEPCKIEGVPMEACIYFGKIADYMVSHGHCRRYSRREIEELLERCHQHGLVSNLNNWQGDNVVMCNCCGCCCSFLKEVKFFGAKARRQVKSNFMAQVDPETCGGCGECVEICQVDALKVNEDIAQADEAFCVGCGNCIAQCPTQSITLIRCNDYCPPDSNKIGLVGLGR